MEDFACLAMAHSDRLGLEAIKSLHKQLDDDNDGNIDLSESDDVSESLKFIKKCYNINQILRFISLEKLCK